MADQRPIIAVNTGVPSPSPPTSTAGGITPATMNAPKDQMPGHPSFRRYATPRLIGRRCD